ncbi:uncharacterized protein LOC132296379 [Cornus florida]|uniref:uncharacterized protein LOC132296379 n=1 Tax=Cornus florida TaxID=4283 RepID=UPI00289ADFB0|nr:uncharacterized protein LOC132296379 [Cornus florida]
MRKQKGQRQNGQTELELALHTPLTVQAAQPAQLALELDPKHEKALRAPLLSIVLSSHTVDGQLNKVLDYCAECGIQVISSTSYFAQSNRQAEASNKVILNILEKMIENNPKEWHHLLFEALWAYRNSKRSSTGVTPYMLTYGHDVVLPMEITIRSARVVFHNNLTPADYNHAMLVELEDLDEVRLNALDHIIAQKKKVMRAYNTKVKAKTFVEGDLVWQVKFPPGVKSLKYGKWTPNWEGPYLVERVLRKGAYRLMDIDEKSHKHPVNGVYLKEYHPSIYENWKSIIIQSAT